jgi:phosphoribosyl-AMP cyclohydrolase
MSNSSFFPRRADLFSIEEGLVFMPLFEKNDLIPCVTQHADSKEVLMLGWMNQEALRLTISTGYAHYFSRARKRLWRKGERSGQTQLVRRILIDDDQDCLLIFVALSKGASCHVGYRSCFFRELQWQDNQTNFALHMLETRKIYEPGQVYDIAVE